jgi:hypothetical protein
MRGGMIALRKESKEKYVIKFYFRNPSNNRVFFVPLFGQFSITFWNFHEMIFVRPIEELNVVIVTLANEYRNPLIKELGVRFFEVDEVSGKRRDFIRDVFQKRHSNVYL